MDATVPLQPVPPRRTQLGDDVAAYVRDLVMSGQLLPGSSVRPESIGAAMGVSTTPAREGLQALRVEGFLDLQPGRGFIVAPLSGQDIRDLFIAHSLIAGELAARAAQLAEPSDVAVLKTLQQELLVAAEREDMQLLEEMNHAFHRQINLIAKARKIAWVIGLVDRYVPRLFYSSVDGWPQATAEDHSTILEAIKDGNQVVARSSMQEHIIHSGELLATQFDRRAAETRTA